MVSPRLVMKESSDFLGDSDSGRPRAFTVSALVSEKKMGFCTPFLTFFPRPCFFPSCLLPVIFVGVMLAIVDEFGHIE